MRRPAAAGDLLVASSDPALRRRLATRLRHAPGIARVHVARDRAGVERALAELHPPVLLLDLSTRGFGRLETVRGIRTLSPTTGTILLVESPTDAAALRAVKAGARGYCARATEPGLVARAMQLVRQGEIWIGRKVMLRLIEELSALHARRAEEAEDRLALLTRRERQVSHLVAGGASNQEIADRLAITEKTVKAHLTHIFQKLGFQSRLHLAIFTLQVASGATTKVQ
ncbi:MAG: response regulator transcription factor [Candidatus Rokubacteria bacterium]|nr:response regulator transcription factor [Candidatus Rokubacteria bacterium]